MTPTNQTRADCGSMAVTMNALKQEGYNRYEDPLHMISDMITNGLHLTRRYNGDPDKVLQIARMNFAIEEMMERSANDNSQPMLKVA